MASTPKDTADRQSVASAQTLERSMNPLSILSSGPVLAVLAGSHFTFWIVGPPVLPSNAPGLRQGGDATGIVGRKVDANGIPDVEPFGMMRAPGWQEEVEQMAQRAMARTSGRGGSRFRDDSRRFTYDVLGYAVRVEAYALLTHYRFPPLDVFFAAETPALA
jgi:hypothetical protein